MISRSSSACRYAATGILILASLAHSMPANNVPCFAPAAPSSPTQQKTYVCRKPVADSDRQTSSAPPVAPVARRLFEDDSDRKQQRQSIPTDDVSPMFDFMAEEDNSPNGFDDMPSSTATGNSHERETGIHNNLPGKLRQDSSVFIKSFATNGMQVVLAIRAWLELVMRQSLESKVGLFVTSALPKMISKMLPGVSTRHSIQELAYMSAMVWVDALYRIIKHQFSVVLHALWRQGLIIAHSFR
jgi:hypothetical protein